MPSIKKFQVGEAVSGWPVHSWNGLVDAVERFSSDPTLPPQPLAGVAGKFDQVVNESGAALDAPFSILRLESPINEPADNAAAPYQGLLWSGKDPDADTVAGKKTWCILQAPVADGSGGPGGAAAVVTGLSWVKIDVQDAADTTAGPIDGDNTKLESGTGSATIVWKEAGTGEKWAIVLLGGGGGAANSYYRAIVTFDNDIGAAFWEPTDSIEGPRNLNPGVGLVYKLFHDPSVNSGNAQSVETTLTPVLNDYTKTITTSAEDKALIVHVLNGHVINVDCNEIDWEPFPPA